MTHPKRLIFATALVACAAAVFAVVKLHADAPAGAPAAAADSTKCPGFDTPENALRSLGWAGQRGDPQLIRDGVTEEIQEMVHTRHGTNAAAHALSVANQLGQGKLIKKEALSDDEVLLYVQPVGKDNPWKVRMQKVGGQWKLAGLTP